MSSAGWLYQDTPYGVQVMPLDDSMHHVYLDCLCRPSRREEGGTCFTPFGPKLRIRAVVTHHAADGRD